MLEFIVGLMLYAFWFALILNFVVLFGMRIAYVILHKKSVKDTLLILFLPFSFGYLTVQKEKNVFHLIYQIILWVLLISILLGGLMLFYTHFA